MNKVNKLIKSTIIVDNAFGFEPEIEVPYKWDVINRYANAGFSHLSLSIATDMTSLQNTMHYLASVKAHILKARNLILVESLEDIYRAKKENKLALSFMFQGINPIEKNIDLIEVFAKLGVRSMIVAYNIANAFGSGCIEPKDSGLSLLGHKAIAEMNKQGVLIDLSHTGYKTSLDVLEASAKPVIFSHSNVHALHPHQRNLKDEQIHAIAKLGGFIGINGNGPLLGDLSANVSTFVDHIEYICDLVGDDFVGLGTDYVYFTETFNDFMQKNAVVYPSNYGVGSIDSFESRGPEQIIELVEHLLQRKFSDESIIKILGANYLRVVKDVWRELA